MILLLETFFPQCVIAFPEEVTVCGHVLVDVPVKLYGCLIAFCTCVSSRLLQVYEQEAAELQAFAAAFP